MSGPFWDSERGAFTQLVLDVGESSLWDTAFIGGMQLPGLVKVDGIEAGRKWDVKTGPGIDGATITDQGYEVAKPTLTVTIWTPAHWVALQEVLAVISPKPGKSTQKPPVPFPLSHPAANLLGVNNVLILGVAAPKPGSVKGSQDVVIKCVQWLKMTASVWTPANLTLGTTAVTSGAAGGGYTSAPSKGGGGPN